MSQALKTVPAPAAEDAATLSEAILRKLTYSLGKSRDAARERDWYLATALVVRDRFVERWIADTRDTYASGAKQVYYLSLEFLIGRLLRENLSNTGLLERIEEALTGLGVEAARVMRQEPDAALGNGGLGRLAACFMESLASLAMPAFGYGIRYDHGLFRQVIRDGWQEEHAEDWLTFGNPWEFARPEISHRIGFGGTVETLPRDGSGALPRDGSGALPRDGSGALPRDGGGTRQVWRPAENVLAVAYDTPVVGWRGRHVNTLRLWSARAEDALRIDTFNSGDHVGAVADRARAEAISRLLYPSDESPAGQELRLRQEYFFSSAALQDLVRRHLRVYRDLGSLPEKVAIQLNDTHPAIAVAELMRILVDLHDMPWAQAWEVTRGTFNYTNHTLLPEALESWPVTLMERLLPRHMQIIYLINAQHLDAVAAARPGDMRLLSSLSLIEEGHGRRVRMGHLAVVGSRRVNGVSALHTELLKSTLFADFHALEPERIVNKTNGVTFRRWLTQCNPPLTRLLTEAIGPRFLDDAEALADLAPLAEDAGFRDAFAAAKRANKVALAATIERSGGVALDPAALFDVHIKRIHEYKRQLLNLLETVALYEDIRARPRAAHAPRVKIFSGKAAASYRRAKLIIKLTHDIARTINADPTTRGLLKVVFLPNYNVSLAEQIVPAADLSEQISTAGMEASGTGNMKLALNGALTIGTLDGANVEIAERVGRENIFIFGLTAEEVEQHRRQGWRGEEAARASPRLAELLESIASGVFSHDDPGRYRELIGNLRAHDHFMVLADFDAYWDAQRAADRLFLDPAAWWRAAILNTARVAWFSSDRTIREYAEEIWRVSPVA